MDARHAEIKTGAYIDDGSILNGGALTVAADVLKVLMLTQFILWPYLGNIRRWLTHYNCAGSHLGLRTYEFHSDLSLQKKAD